MEGMDDGPRSDQRRGTSKTGTGEAVYSKQRGTIQLETKNTQRSAYEGVRKRKALLSRRDKVFNEKRSHHTDPYIPAMDASNPPSSGAPDYLYDLLRVEFLDKLTITRALRLCSRCMQPLSKAVSDDEYDRDNLCEKCAKDAHDLQRRVD